MTSDDSQQTVANETVGQQLKQAREKQGLSVSQIADAQHLRNSIIQAIESGDYGQIDSELFLKGYVRAYAKQVGLNGDAIIAELDRELEPARLQKERELEANPLVDIERRRRKKRRVAKLLLLVVAIVLIGALAVMFVMPKFISEAADVEQSATAETQEQAKEEALVAGSDMQVVLGSGNEPEPSDTGIAPFEDQATASVPPEELVEDQIPVVAQTTEPVLAKPPVSDEPSPVLGQLEIVFTGDCWVQVSDAAGNRLASSMKRAGERLDVSGKAPLNVVIGAVDTVKTIRFQGEIVNIGDFPVVNNRSEFTLAI
jgi:cytoskeleton protein RodZ